VPLRSIVSLVSLALVAALAAGASALAAPEQTGGAAPGLVHRGQVWTISVKAPRGAKSCSAKVKYADGKVQQLAARKPRNLRVQFTPRVPLDAALGAGTWLVTCGKAPVASAVVSVVDVKSTTVDSTPKVVVDRQGFSQRPDRYGDGSLISYGLMLKNTSAGEDADKVYVIVNMVASNGALIGSKSRTVPVVGAGSAYAFGDSFSLRTQEAVAKLEVTIRVGAHEPKQSRPMPDFANVHIFQNAVTDPGWVSEVDGETVNSQVGRTLQSANLSIVIFDAAGNPIGGSLSYAFVTIPAGSRFVFLAQTGFGSIPITQAASVVISAEPTWVAGG